MSQLKLSMLRAKEFDFDLQHAFSKAWKMFLAQPLYSIAFTMLILSIQLVIYIHAQPIAFLYGVLLAPPLFTGYYLIANRISEGQPVVYMDFFKGFSFMIPSVLIWLVGQLLTGIGLVLFIIPGIYLIVAYSFSVLMAVFGGFDFWTAMEESRKLISVRWWKFFGFTLILIGINVIAALPYGIGLLVTIPVSFYATYVVFEEITREALATGE
jgi:uncharacterized membrane protein